MSVDNPWARHYFREWQKRAGDSRLPYWLRVAALAYGSHLDNGHATFKRGEIALVLGVPDGRGGVTPMANVGRAIQDAVGYGWLDGESFWGCLIVPAHVAKRGPLDRNPSCPVHVRRARRRPAEGRTHHSVRDSAC